MGSALVAGRAGGRRIRNNIIMKSIQCEMALLAHVVGRLKGDGRVIDGRDVRRVHARVDARRPHDRVLAGKALRNRKGDDCRCIHHDHA